MVTPALVKVSVAATRRAKRYSLKDSTRVFMPV